MLFFSVICARNLSHFYSLNLHKMLSKISIVLNVVLLIAVINLYIKGHQIKNEQKQLKEVTIIDRPMKIAYINIDSLNVKYEFIKDLRNELDKEIEKKQRRMERKTQKLQSEFNQLQRLSSTMTPSQLQAAQQRVMEMEREIQTMQQDLASELQEDQLDMQKKLISTLDSFMVKYNDEAQYDYILKKFSGSDILIAKEEYDITDTIVSLLNLEYEKKSEEAAKK